MKTSLLFVALLGVSSFVVAQTKKGDQFLSGSVGIGLGTNERINLFQSKNTVFAPSVYFSQTKFFKDNWAFSWGVNYAGTFNTINFANSNNIVSNNHNLSVSGSWLYFYGQNRWRVFAGLGLNAYRYWRKSKSGFTNESSTSNSFSFSPNFTVGGLYFLNPKWALSASTNVNSFPINASGFSIGLTYAPKGKLTENETTQLPTFQKGGSIWGLELDLKSSFNSDNPRISNTTNTQNLAVSYGKLISDRLVLGGSIGLSSFSSQVRPPTYSKSYSTTVSLGLYVKKYYSANRLTPFSSFSIAHGLITNGGQSSTAPYRDRAGNITTLGAEAGLAYLISNHFFVEASLASVRLSRTADYDYVFYNLNANGALSPSLRVQYVFR